MKKLSLIVMLISTCGLAQAEPQATAENEPSAEQVAQNIEAIAKIKLMNQAKIKQMVSEQKARQQSQMLEKQKIETAEVKALIEARVKKD